MDEGDPNFPGWGRDGRALHKKLPPGMWCVTPQDLRFLRQEVRQAIEHRMVMPIIEPVFDDERPDPFNPEDDRIGPNMYNLTDNYIKPLTLDAGRMSWALLRNPEGLPCDLFITHAWQEGAFEFLDKVLASWPRGKRAAWCCVLAMPQSLPRYINSLIAVPRTSPFALALQNASHMLVVPTQVCSIYSRLWCGYEAYLATYYNKVVITARPPLKRLPSVAVALLTTVTGAVVGFFWSAAGKAAASPTDTFDTWKDVVHSLQVSYALGAKPPFIFEDVAAGCVVLVVLCGRSSRAIAGLNCLGSLALGFILGFWTRIFSTLGFLPLRVVTQDPTGKFLLIPLFFIFLVSSEMDRLHAVQRKQESSSLQLKKGTRVQDATCGNPDDTNTIKGEIADRWSQVEASVQVLLDSGMSTPALREVRQQQFSVRGLADVKLSRCWLALAVWLFHFLLYGCSDALLGGMNGILMGSTVVLWCSAERDDKAFLGSLSAKIVTLAFATCYAISYGFKLKELADVQKALIVDLVLLGVVEQVTKNHTKMAPGMFYGLQFPWTEEMLLSSKFGAEWLTQAMHVAGTLPLDNKVTKVSADPFKITTGNNGGKFLFEVEYQNPSEDLHTRLFAKIPHSMEMATQSDRLSSSVNKQPMEFYELNSSRLLEAELPVKIPRYYFGDISNETSNWILITESVPFKDPKRLDFEGKTRGDPKEQLKPFEIEGPYDKCMDWCLRGTPSEYYMALVKCGARMAGLAKAGKFGDEQLIGKYFENFNAVPKEAFGMQPGCSGQPPNQLKAKLDSAMSFMADTGKALFPSFCGTEAWQNKFRGTMMKLNAYFAEMNCWCHADKDYIAFTHNNLNVDNAYFWRDEAGNLDLGVFDWGSMGSKSLGFKMWWWLYCGEFEEMSANMDRYLDCCVESLQEYGGPRLDKEVLRMQFILTALSQMFGLVAAVGQIYKMCPKKEWPSIKDRYDPRVGENIHGKSTLRLYLQVMRTICLIIEEWKADKVLDEFEAKATSTFCQKKDPSTMTA
ncbi:unnamed protein product [Symbiodinium microadriaticum]|nr:unnamed protein product [Symbiodinium microadriaticum]